MQIYSQDDRGDRVLKCYFKTDDDDLDWVDDDEDEGEDIAE